MSTPIVWETVKMAAERTHQSQDLIRAAVNAGDLEANPIGKGKGSAYRLDADEVDIWMKSRSWEPKAS